MSSTEVSVGDHVCAVLDSDEQLTEIASDFVATGLALHQKVVFLDDEGAAEAVVRRLYDDLLDVSPFLNTGQLAILPQEATRGSFEAPVAELATAISATIDEALDAGYAGFRFTGQLSSAAHRAAGVGLEEYDAGLDEVFRGRPVTALCPYDRRRFPAEEIEQLRQQHPGEVVAPAIYDDGLLRITRTSRFGARLAGEIDHSNRAMVAHVVGSALDGALRSAGQAPEIRLNIASLRFIDVAGVVALVHAAESFPDSHRLVVTGAHPAVRRILDRCGAPFATQLVIEGADRK